MQLERGTGEENQNTPHLQGYVVYTNKKSLAQQKKINQQAHWEVRKGSHEQASHAAGASLCGARAISMLSVAPNRRETTA